MMLDMSVLRIKLRYGLDCKPRERLAGHWMVWFKDGLPQISRPETDPVCYERIKRREGEVLIGVRHTRQYLAEVWILAGDYDLDAHWPQWEGLGCRPLPRAEALRAISAAIEAATHE
jgi:hypothetical protein